MLKFCILCFMLSGSLALDDDAINIITDYFTFKDVKFVSYFSCENVFYNNKLINKLTKLDIRVSVQDIREYIEINIEYSLRHWNVPVGVLLDGTCDRADDIMKMSSKFMLFDSMHAWLILYNKNKQNNTSDDLVNGRLSTLELSIDADIIVVTDEGSYYKMMDVFNFGKIQGNSLEINSFGVWSQKKGLDVRLKGFKYYFRWDFHNLTLRAISVILGGRPTKFTPNILSEMGYTTGVSAMTKTTAQLLEVFKEQHNFRFNYTIVDRWVGNPKRNSTLAVTNSLFWREQDISVTCIRIFPRWLDWIDPFFPPTTFLETKFYYIIPNNGVGDFENRFLTPLSPSVWWCSLGAACSCGILLIAAAAFEQRPLPVLYAVFSVLAATCQQAYEDGVQLLEETISSQGRRLILLVLGLTSMLLYNYYTSSVVSWLLNAAAPTIATMDGLIASDLELTFEDIGYTRQWLEGPGFYYYAGFKWEKEDELRDKKVKNSKRTVPLLQRPVDGIMLVRTGKYAYHTEPYTASQIIGPKFNDRELCELGSLQMLPRNPVYIVGQKRSPYRQFFIWSLMRAMERGHIQAARRRVGGEVPGCAGRTPRALALGQAAPAFALLAYAVFGTLIMLAGEICWFQYQKKTSGAVKINTWVP